MSWPTLRIDAFVSTGSSTRQRAIAIERALTHEAAVPDRDVPRLAQAPSTPPSRPASREPAPCRRRPAAPPFAAPAPVRHQRLEVLERVHERVVLHDRFRGRRELGDQRPEPQRREQRVAPLARRALETGTARVRTPRRRRCESSPARGSAAPDRRRSVRPSRASSAVTSSARASSASSEPKVEIRSRAPFSPMPGTPFTLSMESPISARTSTTWSGRHAELLGHARGIEPGALVARVVDADAVADQLEEVLVAGDDRHLEAGRRRLRRQRADHIVGLEARAGEDGHAHRLARLVHPGDLLPQVVAASPRGWPCSRRTAWRGRSRRPGRTRRRCSRADDRPAACAASSRSRRRRWWTCHPGRSGRGWRDTPGTSGCCRRSGRGCAPAMDTSRYHPPRRVEAGACTSKV